jgi:hypothetical protein
MPTSSAARKAWNEAMKATAGATALPPGLQPQRRTKRRSDRNKKGSSKRDRRARARKVQFNGDDDDEYAEHQAACWVDALEGIDAARQSQFDSGLEGGGVGEDADDEYDELAELEASSAGGGKRKRGGGAAAAAAAAKKRKKAAAAAGVLPQKFLPRSMASILVEEAGREDGVARAFLNAEAKVSARPPRRKFCPVTGVAARYVEPKSGIPYSNFRSLEQIRERPPPWMVVSGSASYLEASKSILEGG